LPIAVALLGFFLSPLELSLGIRFALNKAELDKLATLMIAHPGASYPDCQVGSFTLTRIHEEGGGFVCEVEGLSQTVHNWGFRYFPPPANAPTVDHWMDLQGGWSCWRD